MIGIDFEKDALFDLKVGPELAIELLDRSIDHNRALSKAALKGYVRDMREGNWYEYSPQPLIFSKDGELIDGQHRLWAVVESGATVGFKVLCGQDGDSFVFIDSGKSRRAKDFIDADNAKECETIAILAFKVAHGVPFRSAVVGKSGSGTRQDTLKTYRSDSENIAYYAKQMKRVRASLSCGQTRSMGLFCYVIDKLCGRERLEEFLEYLVNPHDESVFRARESIIKRYARDDSKPSPQWLLGVLFQMFDGFGKGVPFKSFNRADASLTKFEDEFRAKVLKDASPNLESGWAR